MNVPVALINCTVLYCTVLYFTVLYCTVLYCTMYINKTRLLYSIINIYLVIHLLIHTKIETRKQNLNIYVHFLSTGAYNH